MIDREKEYRKAFYFLKRCSKSPLTPSYTRSYSAGLGDREPARKTYDYISLLSKDANNSFEEKINLLNIFLQKTEEEERNLPQMGSSFYSMLQSYIRRSKSNIEKGEPVQTKRK